MGLTKVVLEITNPDDKSKTVTGEFLVDSGAFYTVLPKRFDNDTIASTVILGKTKDSPLMGALTLESFGLILDPFKRTLHPAKLML